MPPRVTTPPTSKPDPLAAARSVRVDSVPVWGGPCGTGPNGGVTYSLLNRALSCRARFKVHAIDGWRRVPTFEHRPFFGSCWHAAEEVFAKDGSVPGAIAAALDYAEREADRFPAHREEVRKWWNVVRVTFPEYARFWEQNPEVLARTPLLQEQVFDVPYKLPSGRVVRLRGKWDGLDYVSGGPNPGLYWFESKTKGEVDEVRLQRQLTFDLQTLFYIVAGYEQNDTQGVGKNLRTPLWGDYGSAAECIKGVRFNVIRRPLSGGKGTIVRHKPTKSNPDGESEESYYDRLRAYIQEEPQTYFFRWTVDVTPADVSEFRRTFLDPFLEYLCSWYEQQTAKHGVLNVPATWLHWRLPYGVTNQIQDGYEGDVDHYITSGSTVGLVRQTDLFPELNAEV